MSMQAAQRLGLRTTLLWIALFTLLTTLALSFSPGVGIAEAVAFAIVYAVLDCFLAVYALVARRAEEAGARNRTLADALVAANRETEACSRQTEALAAAEERHRLARELHDSVTQTVFSMNLTAQSAVLLLPRDAGAAAAQLERLEDLGRSALTEIDALGSELGADARGEGDLEAQLRRNLAERELPGGLSVTIAVEGESVLSAGERHSLVRIAQEALNNVAKHARAREAAVRVRLAPPRRLEVVDDGVGFDPVDASASCGMGLGSMRERAQELGWTFRVTSAPGRGTSVVVEEGRAGPEAPAGEGRTEP
jgi:signal transduction histidine kinase